MSHLYFQYISRQSDLCKILWGLCHCCMLAEMSLTDYCKHSQCCPWVTGWIVKFLNTFLEKAKNILSNGPKWLNYMIMG